MESGDGGWIRADAAQWDEDESLGEVEGLDEDDGRDEDDGWPGDDGWPATAAAPSAGKRWGHGGIPGFSAWVAAAVTAVAATAGVAAGLFLIRGTSPAGAVAGATSVASAAAARREQVQVAVTGRVLAVSGTSITIGGAGPSVTAAVTSATTVTGGVRDIGGVKAGDEVSAQLTGTAAHLTATAIQDPARA